MAALMCVNSDSSSELIESRGKEGSVMEVLDRESEKLKERGSTAVWLELEEFGIDDEMLRSVNLCDRFPVRTQ